MRWWYVSDPGRFEAERAAIAALEAEVSWLQVRCWRIEPTSHLCLDADIDVAGKVHPVTLRYGVQFPYAPPTVAPQAPERWSDHQYGTEDLCLEYGPDNWRTSLTGADMLRSAEKLLREQPAPHGTTPPVPSRHFTTVGQDFRHTFVRTVVTEAAHCFLSAAGSGCTLAVEYWAFCRDKSCLIVPKKVTSPVNEVWVDATVPQALESLSRKIPGLAFGLPNGASVPNPTTRAELCAYLGGYGFSAPDGYSPDKFECILVNSTSAAFLFWTNEDGSVTRHRVLRPAGGERLSAAHAALHGKTVGIVGCGSAGGKIAVMLARCQVRKFVLVDDDVFTPENNDRNELDWSNVGEHKAEGLARRVNLVAPQATCDVVRQHLGGQESNASFDWCLTRLRECDIIVDATANPAVFNILSAISTNHRSLLWLEVFAGGIGGLIARARPSLDPEPLTVRARIDAWCAAKSAETGAVVPSVSVAPYTGVGSDSQPLVADDADVTVIASHAARMCVDALLERTPSSFPDSAYLIGLAPAWIFEQPFHTWPIDVGLPEPREPDEPVDVDHIATIIRLMGEGSDGAAPSP